VAKAEDWVSETDRLADSDDSAEEVPVISGVEDGISERGSLVERLAEYDDWESDPSIDDGRSDSDSETEEDEVWTAEKGRLVVGSAEDSSVADKVAEAED
jgi:hypothetical protein